VILLKLVLAVVIFLLVSWLSGYLLRMWRQRRRFRPR
jgi:hypothetical protein